MPIALPPGVETTIRTVFGERGELWLTRLPAVVDELLARWDAELIGDSFGGGTHSFVAPVRRGDGSVAVLKVPVVDEENVGEPAGLFCYDGDGAVRLYDFDPGTGALLLEWARPGTALLEQPGFPSLEGRPEHAEKIELAGHLYRRLRRPPAGIPADFPALPRVADIVADWTARFTAPEPELAQVIPPELLAQATAWCAALATPDGPLLIVNRDTHLGNILAAEREPWLLIDPKPYLGEAAFDAGFLIMIGTQHEPTRQHADRLVRHTARALGVDADRARGWAFLRSLEEIAWGVEDDEPDMVRLHLAVAAALANR
ncbi:aminoglycoside phosphotransferase family protein [Nocardia blacklockiae]|uniref:aminoglycoside phosphotransferase family protein n=1 Tax=Nocardia blacklockiae TaxID=480036 RepID=UPI001893810F|nr:aminoglycoside phosphotransferase family protein [Nocardia blacklockiae]MBF6176492.1 kinase [Nocardia blacklockiae]